MQTQRARRRQLWAGDFWNSVQTAGVKPFEEIVEFIAQAAGPERLARFKPSSAAEKRVGELLRKQKEGTLKSKEQEELQLFVQLDHVMSLAKAKARARSRAAA
jgi:hypothetical protein